MGRLSWRAGGALLLFLCIAVAGTAALTAEEIELSPATLTITAGDGGGTIGVTVNNDSVEIVDKVTFEYLNAGSDPSGALSVTSDSTPPYQTEFYSELAGDARILITVHYKVGNAVQTPVEKEYNDVRVIPADPYKYLNITYATTVTVGDTTPITVRMEDEFGNVINDETGVTIDFWFLDQHLTALFIGDNCTITLPAPTTAQTILIGIYPGYGKSLDRIISIDAISLREPASINSHIVTVAPDGSTTVSDHCMADGISYFDVGYTVLDNYSNPIANYPVHFYTDAGTSKTIITSDDGIGHAKVGPQKSIGKVTVTGEAGAYKKEDVLTFTGGSAQGYGLSVNPSDIPSYEVDPTVRAAIQARVFNSIGTGVVNESVTFSIKSGSITNVTPMVHGPVLEGDTPISTDENGYATIYLRAGEFPDSSSPDFYHSAMGSCIVEATWNGSTKLSPEITWRNYPYLRVETNVSKSVVAPGETIDVTIHLIGDGNEFQNPGNISLVLCLDRGEDMLLDEMDGGQRDRMLAAREAAMHLVEGGDELEATSTNVALVTYGDPTTNTDIYPNKIADYLTIPANSGATFWKKVGTPGDDDVAYVKAHYPGNGNISYPLYSRVDQGFDSVNNDWEYLRTALNKTVPVKGVNDQQVSAPIRDGLKTSIDYLKNSNPGDTRAIVLLMQNSYRYYGDPLARGSTLTPEESTSVTLEKNTPDYLPYGLVNENMAAYAAENNIVIYAIYYATGNAQGELETATLLTQSTGGQLYVASTYSELVDAFEKTKADIQRKAGLDTSVHLSFAEVPEDFTYTSTELLTYIPNTTVDFFNWTTYPYDAASQEDRLPGYAKYINQISMWLGTDPGSSPGTLEFDVGNISVKQTWMTEFQFKINDSISEPLNFSLFGGDSKIEFLNEDGSTLTQFLPPITVTVIPDLAPETLFDATIDVYNLNATSDEPSSFAYFSWDINYTGAFPMDQQFYIRKMDGDDTSWKKIGSIPLPSTANEYQLSLYTGDLETGLYEARTRVSTADAGYDEETRLFGVGIVGVDYYIRLT